MRLAAMQKDGAPGQRGVGSKMALISHRTCCFCVTASLKAAVEKHNQQDHDEASSPTAIAAALWALLAFAHSRSASSLSLFNAASAKGAAIWTRFSGLSGRPVAK